MQIIIDNIMQNWWNIDCSPIISLLIGALILSLFIWLLFGLFLYVNWIAADLWPINRTTDNHHEIKWTWASFKDKLSNKLHYQSSIFSAKFWQKTDCLVAFCGLLSSWTACLFLPWSISHCNLPSQVTMSGFCNQADLLCFFGFILLSYLSELALQINRQVHWQNLLWSKLSWLYIFLIICLGPVVLTGNLSISEIIKAQTEGIFGISWLGLYAIPCFLGIAAALICFYNWQRNFNDISVQKDIKNFCSPQSIFLLRLIDSFNFFSLACLLILLFGGGWNIPNLVYPAYINLGFLIASNVDLLCAILVFILKLLILSALWPCLYHYLENKSAVSFNICLTLAISNFLLCLTIAGFSVAS